MKSNEELQFEDLTHIERSVSVYYMELCLYEFMRNSSAIKSFTNNDFNILVASYFLNNQITIRTVEEFLNRKKLNTPCKNTIKKSLNKLKLMGFLFEFYPGAYATKSKHKTVKDHCESRNIRIRYNGARLKSFYNSRLQIYSTTTFERFHASKFKHFYHFICSEMLCRLYYGVPVTKYIIEKELGWTQATVREVTKSFLRLSNKAQATTTQDTELKLPHYVPFKDEQSNKDYRGTVYECVGNEYIKNVWATTAIIPNFLKQRTRKYFDWNIIEDGKLAPHYSWRITSGLETQRFLCGLNKPMDSRLLNPIYSSTRRTGMLEKLANRTAIANISHFARLVHNRPSVANLRDNMTVLKYSLKMNNFARSEFLSRDSHELNWLEKK